MLPARPVAVLRAAAPSRPAVSRSSFGTTRSKESAHRAYCRLVIRTADDVLPPRLPALLAARLPFFYGWVVLGVLCFAGFARQGPAVATLSVFVTPLTRDFGWSRTALSGAVSLGGVLAAIVSP